MTLDKTLLARRFGRAAPGYEAHAHVQERAAEAVLAAVLRARPAAQRPAVLDVGCGTGALTARLLAALPGASATAVDLAPVMIAEARRRLAGLPVEFVVGDIEEGFPAGRCDLVASSMALQWTVEPAAVLRAAAQRLEPGGTLALAVPVAGTLGELRQAYVHAAAELGLSGWRHPGLDLHPAERWARWAGQAFEEVALEERTVVERHPTARAALESVRGVGASDCGGGAGPAAVRLVRSALARWDERRGPGGVPATWNLAVLTARGPRRFA